MDWPLVALLVLYPLFVIGACALTARLMFKADLFSARHREIEAERLARQAHEIRRAELEIAKASRLAEEKREYEEREDRKREERKQERIEETLAHMGWSRSESTEQTSHPAGPVPISPEDAELERARKNARRLAEIGED